MIVKEGGDVQWGCKGVQLNLGGCNGGCKGKKFCTSRLFGLKSAVVYMSASSGRQVEESMSSCRVMRLTMESVEAADTDGEYNGCVLRGDESVVRGRREAAAESSRARAAGRQCRRRWTRFARSPLR